MFKQGVQKNIESGEYMIHMYISAVHQLDFLSHDN